MTTTIVVIEDDRQIRKVVASYLQQAGYRVLTAPDGLSGLALAQHEKPTPLVLDLIETVHGIGYRFVIPSS